MRAVRSVRFSGPVVLLLATAVLLSPPPAFANKRGVGSGRSTHQPAQTTKQKPHPAVVRILAHERNGTSHGSGTLVGLSKKHGLVLTNWHVVRDATGQIVVEFPDGFRSAARVLRTDKTWDLAALLIWRPKTTPVPIATSVPARGDRLTIAGYGSGTYRQLSGKVTQYVSPGKNQPFEIVEVGIAARNGDSGGPIFNRHGQLAGVLFGSVGGCTDGSYCKRVRWFLRRALTRMPALAKSIFSLPPARTR